MNVDLAVARLRRALKSSGVGSFLGWAYRGLLPESLRARIQTQDFQHQYGDRASYEVTLGQKKIFFSTKDPYSKQWFFPRYDNQIHEPALTHLFARLAQTADGIMDVGANLGWFTCIAAVLSEGKVYSFEMDEDNVERLRTNVQLNEREESVRIEQVAVTDDTEGATYSKSPGAASPIYSLSTHENEAETQVSVSSTTIDAYCREQVDALDLVKIDVEGAELKVLRGATKTLQSVSPDLLVEVHPNQLQKKDSAAQEVLEMLEENGYTVQRLDDMREAHEELVPVASPAEFSPSEICVLYATHS